MKRRNRKDRRGAVTVEFAFVAPVFVTLFVGMTQIGFLMQVQNQFSVAAREGARSAVYERSLFRGQNGQTTNERVINDVRQYLNASGLPGDDVDVLIATADDIDIPFDLDDPDNAYDYFQLVIEYSVSDLLSVPPPNADEFKISSRVVFRNGRVD